MVLGTGDVLGASRQKGSPFPSQAERLKESAHPLPSKKPLQERLQVPAPAFPWEQCLTRGATHGKVASWGSGGRQDLGKAPTSLAWLLLASEAQTYKVHSLVPSPAAPPPSIQRADPRAGPLWAWGRGFEVSAEGGPQQRLWQEAAQAAVQSGVMLPPLGHGPWRGNRNLCSLRGRNPRCLAIFSVQKVVGGETQLARNVQNRVLYAMAREGRAEGERLPGLWLEETTPPPAQP